ncbi:MAG: N-methyl-L-tryptophan oxidase [Gemmatimonadales bacterium]
MTSRAEVAVVGLGAAGSAALLALARRGVRAVGLDRYSPPHPLGSTHGRSRIIREAYYESPVYVPLVQAAYEAWARIEDESGRRLLDVTGGVMLGPAESGLIQGALRSARAHGLRHELLDGVELQRRLPAFAIPEGTVGLWEPRAGILDPEACVTSCLELAERFGADLRRNTRVTGWSRLGEGIRVETTTGSLDCGRVILAAGAWMGELCGELGLPLTVERQVMAWFAPEPRAPFMADALPVFIWEWEPERTFYGIPDQGAGFKVAGHHDGETTTPDTVDRTVTPRDIDGLRALLRRFIPAADHPPTDAVTCLYTNTPDRDFVLGAHPQEPRVLLASPCSGHGFKFASAVGEVLADLVIEGTTPMDLVPFRPDRFGPATASGKA